MLWMARRCRRPPRSSRPSPRSSGYCWRSGTSLSTAAASGLTDAELGALRDRFVLKALSSSVRETHFDDLLALGVQNDLDRALNRKPWVGIADVNDESSQGITRIVITLKRDAAALVILNNLFKFFLCFRKTCYIKKSYVCL